jgi:hypothetical protein
MARVDGNGAVAPTAWTAMSFHCGTTASLVPARLGLAEHSPPRRMALRLRDNSCFIGNSVACSMDDRQRSAGCPQRTAKELLKRCCAGVVGAVALDLSTVKRTT